MTDIIRATFTGLELRVPDVSERIVEGIVVPWNEVTFLTADPRGERFRSGSLTRTIKERGDRVKLFRNHDHDQAVGRAVQWKATHEGGCWAQFRIAATVAGDEVLAEVREGMLDAFSVGFLPKRETRGADGAREIIEAQLHEVSLCPIGAYDGARVLAMRSSGSHGHTGAPQATIPPMPEVDLSPLVLPMRWRG
jgi:HK97 family phage prohead protease